MMNLQEVIDITLLQKVQDTFSEATGLAAVTVDFRGNPITEYSNFSPFCKLVRKDSRFINSCLKCDAYGGLEAARKEAPYVYRCHTGLMDFAVPIIVKGQLIGSMLAGQVKLNDSDIDNPDYITHDLTLWQGNKEMQKAYDNIPVISYEKIKAAAEMMFYVINNIFEKDIMHFVQEELNIKNQQIIDQLKVQTELEKELKEKLDEPPQPLFDPHFIGNMMNTLSCLAIIEKAPQTQEVILTLTDLIKYSLNNDHQLVRLKDEITYIEKLLRLQNIRFDRLHVHINIPEEHHSIRVPSLLLQLIINQIVRYRIEPHGGEGAILINGYSGPDDYIIEITAERTNFSKVQGKGIFKGKRFQNSEQETIALDLQSFNKILTTHYGEDYELFVSDSLQGGTTVTIKIPID